MNCTLDILIRHLTELKAMGWPGTTQVKIAYDFGDRSHTIVCPDVSFVGQAFTKYNNYVEDDTPVSEEVDNTLLQSGEPDEPGCCIIISDMDVHPWRSM